MGRLSLFRIALVALALGVGLNCSNLQAAIVFQFGTELGPGFNQYTVAPGSLLNLDVYLYETVTAPDSSLFVAENGLTSAQFTIQRTNSSSGLPAVISSYVANTPEFDDLFSPVENSFGTAELDLTQFADIGAVSGVLGDDLGGGIRRVFLSSLGIMASRVGGQITSFSLSDNPTFDETSTFTFPGTLLDSMISAGQIDVRTTGTAAIPEPSAVAIWASLAGFGLIATGFRRHRAVGVTG